MKSALFVDFDNVYSGLRRLDVMVADRFALQPVRWIQWLAEELATPQHAPTGARRRLLVRRCYLNPQLYQRFRPAFNRAGFEIIDCPAMTAGGKTGTDIHMVLDIVDLLEHEVQYDEFMVFSADADFTPVLRKLRRWDRRTTVLAVGFPSAAYQASADLLIDQDDFVRRALGFDEPEDLPPLADGTLCGPNVVAAVTGFILRTVAGSPQPVSLPWLASKAPLEIAGLAPANWSGFNSFRALIDSLPLAPLVVDWERNLVCDRARHSLLGLPPPALATARESGAALSAVTAMIRREVARIQRPVPCARLAQRVAEDFEHLASDWAGKGSFRRLLEALDLAPLQIEWGVDGGRVVNPSWRSQAPADGSTEAQDDWRDNKPLQGLLGQVSAATGVPALTPRELRFLLESIAGDARDRPFHLSETGKRVRDRWRDAGHGISRCDVSFVLKGVLLGGHVFGQGNDNADVLAACFIGSVLELCQREQLGLDDAKEALLRSWVA